MADDKKYRLDDFGLYNLAREFRKKVYKLIKQLPPEERFCLDPQMRKAIVSVTNNIAEGHGRWHYQENIQFCRISRGSVEEILDDINVCLDEGYGEKGYNLLSAVIVILYTTGIWNNEVERISFYRETKYVQSYKQGFLPEPEPGIEPAGPASGFGSSVRLPFDTSTTTGTLLSLPIGFLYVMLSPFPWDLIGGSLRMKLTLPELLLWWCLIYYGIIGLRYALKHKLAEVFPILLFLASLSFLYSWLFANIGLVYRQRVHLMPFIIIFAALGIILKRQKRESGG